MRNPTDLLRRRSVASTSTANFATQLAERNAELSSEETKRFKSSLAPKGTKLAQGYQDRTKLRSSTEDDEKASRVDALEDMVKLGQIDESTFQKLRDEIVGSDIQSTHLVKGLDRKLLERVRRGENVFAEGTGYDEQSASTDRGIQKIDVDDELDKLEGQSVIPVIRSETVKLGIMAPPAVIGKKRTRDEILKVLRAARAEQGTKSVTELSPLGSKFRKVGQKLNESRIERDDKGNEVLILVDADGKVKRKVRKQKTSESKNEAGSLLVPDKSVAPLGMTDLPPPRPPSPLNEDLDIFEGVGTDFNPLRDILGSDIEEDQDDDDSIAPERLEAPYRAETSDITTVDQKVDYHRPNYFNDSETEKSKLDYAADPNKDPMILAALKRASKIQGQTEKEIGDTDDAAKVARRKKLLESRDRDEEDMDLSFGGSRFGDDEGDEDNKRTKLSVWGKEGLQSEAMTSGRKEKRKRGPKKKKGDGENAGDVLKVLERRKGESR